MSHPVEGRKIFDATYRHQMAAAIANGILAYKRQVESADNSKPETTNSKLETRNPKLRG